MKPENGSNKNELGWPESDPFRSGGFEGRWFMTRAVHDAGSPWLGQSMASRQYRRLVKSLTEPCVPSIRFESAGCPLQVGMPGINRL